MADRVLRDHSQPCGDPLDEGGRYQYTDGTWGCDAMGCPGGREVTATEEGRAVVEPPDLILRERRFVYVTEWEVTKSETVPR